MTTTIPDALPILSAGQHESPLEGACIMEYVSILAGEEFSDTPQCSDRFLTLLAQTVNDVLEDDERQLLVPLIPQLVNTRVDYPMDRDQTEAKLWFGIAEKMLEHASTRRARAVEAWLDSVDAMDERKYWGALNNLERTLVETMDDYDPAEVVRKFTLLVELFREAAGLTVSPCDLNGLEMQRRSLAAMA